MKPKAYEDMTHEEQHQHLVLAHGVDGMDFSLWTVEEHQTDHDEYLGDQHAHEGD
jgi:hypothetical protein